ncbi:hypothetical protein WJX73_006924 [Symbiochloris irregularis]|uniref:Uncharacterized protein n=1 Tax=Symbiochloris irregularis TaxID=706552 RepID=A0AAW1NMM0_9CHLO
MHSAEGAKAAPRSATTPAVRWILAHVGQGRSGSATHVQVRGDVDCIIKGSRVACFFAALEERNADYSMSAELIGFPLDDFWEESET